jgi:hypothetical protein
MVFGNHQTGCPIAAFGHDGLPLIVLESPMPQHRTTFTTIRTEGAILPADLLPRMAEGDASLGGLTPG